MFSLWFTLCWSVSDRLDDVCNFLPLVMNNQLLCELCFLQVKNTIDDIMWETVQHKLTNVGKVLDGKEDTLAVSVL